MVAGKESFMNKERQSVYEKALVICHEDEKELSAIQQKLENNKLQRYIDYKLEARKLRTELIQLKREQKQLAKEAKQREKQRKTVDDIAKEVRSNKRFSRRTAAQVQKKFTLPELNCTQRNVPRILKRSLSYESEYFTWTLGLKKVENAAINAHPEAETAANNQARKSSENCENDENENTDIQTRASLKTSDIVYSVPITEPGTGRKRASTLRAGDKQNDKLPPLDDPGIAAKSKRDKSPEGSRNTGRLVLPNIWQLSNSSGSPL